MPLSKHIAFGLGILGLVLVFTQCQPFLPKVPSYFPPSNYRLEPALFDLGRALFYDPILSQDSSVACASCHQLSAAFADSAQVFSLGLNGKTSRRNALPLFNLRWYPYFFWDGGVQHPDFMALAALANPEEMNQSLAPIIERLQKDASYPPLFKRAFGQDSLTSQQLLQSLRHFLESIISVQSPYDQFRQGKATLNPLALKGLALFEKHCASCHPAPLFGRQSFANNGLDLPPFADLGRGRISHQPEDEGRFLIPSLRNLAYTAPYMHDGRFSELSQVLSHYSEHLKPNPDFEQKLRLNLSDQAALLAFLASLNDSSFVRKTIYQQKVRKH